MCMIGKNSLKHHHLEKEVFYNHLNMKDITDVDCVHAKRNCKDFEIKFFPEYHDLDVQSDTLFVS